MLTKVLNEEINKTHGRREIMFVGSTWIRTNGGIGVEIGVEIEGQYFNSYCVCVTRNIKNLWQILRPDPKSASIKYIW